MDCQCGTLVLGKLQGKTLEFCYGNHLVKIGFPDIAANDFWEELEG